MLKQGKPSVDSLSVNTEMRSPIRCIQQLAGRHGRKVDQANEFVAFADRGDVGNIAFGKRAAIGA